MENHMSNSFQIKSRPNELLVFHLKLVASSSEKNVNEALDKMKSSISEQDLRRVSYIIGATHDIGKSTEYFQKYLTGSKDIDPFLKSHSMISSLYCSWAIKNDKIISDSNKEVLQIFSSLAIQGHHGSLKKPTKYLTNLDEFDDKKILVKQMDSLKLNTEVEKISKELGLASFEEFADFWEDHFDKFRRTLFDASKTIRNNLSQFDAYFTTNLLFSSLLDADRMAVTKITSERVEIDSNLVSKYLGSMRMEKLEINDLRKKLFDSLDKVDNIPLNEKIYSLTAPTGLGKTLASMNFALKLRERIRKENGYTPRIIYVAPFISILDQNFDVFKKVFSTSNQSNALLLHHHLAPIHFYKNSFDEFEHESYSTSQSELLISGWSSEIIVTTFVQFFNTIFGRYTSELRRFHNMIGSIVILDEVQSIPFEYWEAVRQALLFLSKKFSIYFVMMTATQPLIFEKDEIHELVPKETLNVTKRVKFHPKIDTSINLQEFCNIVELEIKQNPGKNILVELNTIKNAIEVFNSIHSGGNVFFLSSQVIPKHRRPRINQIKKSLKSGSTVLISTQVVEAGVDLDFDIAIRDIGPIDSIVQTAGRCNRNGIKSAENSPFFIYDIVNDDQHEFANFIYGRVAIDIAKTIVQGSSNLEDLVKLYYEQIKKRKSNQDSNIINQAISELNYEEISNNFKLINEDYKASLFVEYDDDAKKIWEKFLNISKSEHVSRNDILQIKHTMEEYIIGVSEKDIKKCGLSDISGIYRIDNSEIFRYYNEITGFIKP